MISQCQINQTTKMPSFSAWSNVRCYCESLSRLSLLVISLGVSACSSGDGVVGNPSNDTGSTIPVINGDTPYTKKQVNGPLNGYVWVASSGSVLNLQTGEVKSLPGDNVVPSRDGTHYVQLINEWKSVPTGCGIGYDDYDLLLVRESQSGRVISSILKAQHFFTPRLSPDKKSVAVFASTNLICFQSDYDDYLTIFDLDGNVIIEANPSVIEYDWLPDGRLVSIISDGTGTRLSVETAKHTFSYRTILDFSALPPGTPRHLQTSPDGTKILFELVTKVPPFLSNLFYREATVWEVGIDGTGLKKLFDTSRQSLAGPELAEPLVNQPTWSPDGTSLLVTENYKSGAAISFYGTETENHTYIESVSVTPITSVDITYVVPHDSQERALPPVLFSELAGLPVFAARANGTSSITGLNPTSEHVWTNSALDVQQYNGTNLAPNNNKLNRGAAGTLYELRDNTPEELPYILKFDIATGAETQLALSADQFGVDYYNLAVSADASRFALIATRNSFEDSEINVFSIDGSLTHAFKLITNTTNFRITGDLRFSPTHPNLIAWRYVDPDRNYANSIAILDFESGLIMGTIQVRDGIDQFAWSNTGDLLYRIDTEWYVSEILVDRFFPPGTLLFSNADFPSGMRSRATDGRLLYSFAGDIFTANSDGSNVKRVTQPTTSGTHAQPNWSPDGRLISFKTQDSRNRAYINVVSADAENVGIYSGYSLPGVFTIEKLPGTQWDTDHSDFFWR